jgi:hypothetical protein
VRASGRTWSRPWNTFDDDKRPVTREFLKILITNLYLDSHGGTQAVVRDLAIWLHRLGHTPLVYSPRLGVVSQEIASHGIVVTDSLERLGSSPDIIHGQFYNETMRALLHFPLVPAIYVVHHVSAYGDPFYFPRILRYVAVDSRCRDFLETKPEIPRSRIEVVLNAIDMERFQPRSPLPPKPRRALLFSNYAAEHTHVPAVRQACRRMGLTLDVIGRASSTEIANPETVLPRYDLVFGKARCALEAAAVGCATVLCDSAGAGPMVTTSNFDELRKMNFGQNALTSPLHAQQIIAEIERYDAADAALVSERVRKEASLADSAHRWASLYEAVLAESRELPRDADAELRAAGTYLETLSRWSYESRVEWETTQLQRLLNIPVIGRSLHTLAWRALKKWKGKRIQHSAG